MHNIDGVRRLIPVLVLLVAVALGIVLTAGGDDAGGARVPDVEVTALGSDQTLALRSLEDADKPTLLWFWAPWCEVCNGEAPEIERLAAGTDEVRVIAVGGRAGRSEGPAFVERHRLRTPEVFFDEPMKAWRAYRIIGQPAGILLDRDGRERRRWNGAFDTAEVVPAARKL